MLINGEALPYNEQYWLLAPGLWLKADSCQLSAISFREP